MSIRQVFGDLETYWDQEHSLSKMSPILYCASPKTEIISCSFQEGRNGKPFCVFGQDEVQRACDDLQLKSAMLIAHNMSAFDSMIFSWRLRVKPAMWGCTLAMARPIHAKDVGLGLGKLVQHYGIGTKNAAVLHQTKGKRLADFTAQELADMRVYNVDDTSQCAELFYELLPHFNLEELWHIDCNIRMLVQPKLRLDAAMIEAALTVERDHKLRALLKVAAHLRSIAPGIDLNWDDTEAVAAFVMDEMQSAARFSALLKSAGVDVPMKRSKTDPTKYIPAIAKGDEPMQELLEHEDEVVAAAARARLAAKSTQTETRLESFLATHKAVGFLPVPVHYCGADTTGRDSGFVYNMLNLPRIKKTPSHKDAMRKGVIAPPGHKIGVRDLSGIELRVNHTLWKVKRSMDMWAADPLADLYVGTADAYYGLPPGTVTKEDPRRQLGKVLELSCGFQVGAKTLRTQARIQYGLRLTMDEAVTGVQAWRGRYPEIADRDTGGWAKCDAALYAIAEGREEAVDPWGMVTTCKAGLRLPSGRLIRYPDLRQEWVTRYEEDADGALIEKKQLAWVYGQGRHYSFIYGGKVDENIVQALARDVIFGHIFQFWKETGKRPALKVYDEGVYVWKEDEAPELLEHLGRVMQQPPAWWPQLVLASEGDLADRYGDAK